MLAATLIGVFFTPVFYVLMQRISERQWPFRRCGELHLPEAPIGHQAAGSKPAVAPGASE